MRCAGVGNTGIVTRIGLLRARGFNTTPALKVKQAWCNLVSPQSNESDVLVLATLESQPPVLDCYVQGK
jgi:hypothetical protein